MPSNGGSSGSGSEAAGNASGGRGGGGGNGGGGNGGGGARDAHGSQAAMGNSPTGGFGPGGMGGSYGGIGQNPGYGLSNVGGSANGVPFSLFNKNPKLAFAMFDLNQRQQPQVVASLGRQMPAMGGLFGHSVPVGHELNPDQAGSYDSGIGFGAPPGGYEHDGGGDGQYAGGGSYLLPQTAAPAEVAQATPSVLTPYEHLKQRWSGNNFLMAPITRSIG